MKSPKASALLAALWAMAPSGVLSQCFPDAITYSTTQSLTSHVQYTSCDHAADGPKVWPIDLVSYDWWYFDAVSDDGKEAVTIVFFASSALGFIDTTSLESILNVAITGTFANGTTTGNSALATSATVTSVGNGNGASGNWTGSGCSFTGAADLSSYSITIDSPSVGISGTVDFVSRGPGHYACSPLVGGVDEQLIPHVGWANVLPAAHATVDLNFGGSQMTFRGNGYHDKNWGDIPFATAVQSWYWGHGTLGAYELVWFDAIDATGTESVSGYLMRDGHVVASTCTTCSSSSGGSGGLQVRPVGTPYPPTLLAPTPTQFTIVMTWEHGGLLNATLTPLNVQVDSGVYTRWLGEIAGTVDGVEASGSALWEEFNFVVV